MNAACGSQVISDGCRLVEPDGAANAGEGHAGCYPAPDTTEPR
jgi:hypothetical protein